MGHTLRALAACLLLLMGGAFPCLPVVAGESTTIDSTNESGRLEKELQQLEWPQFRAVVEAVPKLKADVDAYGPLGWQYVQARYRTYRWKKNIDKLDPEQREQLAELIRKTKKGDGTAR